MYTTALSALQRELGHAVLTHSAMHPYLQGMMASEVCHQVLCVIQPTSLLGLWNAINIAAAHDLILIPQAANTSLTGGSTPYGQYDRPVVVVSMNQLAGIHLLRGGEELVALPAATLQELENTLSPLGREPHSVLGSTCVGASVIGGICNNSGGALLQRGPAYTEHALYARLTPQGSFELINHLGIELGDDPQTILTRLDKGDFSRHVSPLPAPNIEPYSEKVRQISADTPSRYNGDPLRLFEASGSSGKLIIFAVRLPSYPKPAQEHMFFYSTNDSNILTTLRRQYLQSSLPLPILAEYFDANYAHSTLQYGRDTCWLMNHLSGKQIGRLYRTRSQIERYLSPYMIERFFQTASQIFPRPLTGRCLSQATEYKHHIIIKTHDEHIQPTKDFLTHFTQTHEGSLIACTPEESKALQTMRFAGTAAMLRYYQLHQKQYGSLISTDIALPRNRQTFIEHLPSHLRNQLKAFFSLGHFFCYVFHQDYFLHPAADEAAFKVALLEWYQNQGIQYPAEHNVGHLYAANEAQQTFYQTLDPCNRLNPGIGKTSKHKFWRSK